MNSITAIFHACRYTRQLNSHIKRVTAARGGAVPYLNSPAFERFLEWLEANPSLKWVMISEFDYNRPYTRDDLKKIFADLRAGGVRDCDIMQTFASKSALVYLARAVKRRERHDLIVFALREHWELRRKLPDNLGLQL